MTRLLLLLAAAEPTGDPALLCGGRPGTLASAPRMRPPRPRPTGCLLSEPGSSSAIRWSALRSTRAASAADRRRAHRGALAEAHRSGLDRTAGPGTGPRPPPGPTKDIAAELERSAGRRRAAGSRRRPPSWNGCRRDAGAAAPGGAGAGRGAGSAPGWRVRCGAGTAGHRGVRGSPWMSSSAPW